MRAQAVSNAGMGQQLGLFDAPVPASRPTALPPVKGVRPEVTYRNPDNLWQTWTGRGKPPRWVSEWIQSGKSLEALRIPGVGA